MSVGALVLSCGPEFEAGARGLLLAEPRLSLGEREGAFLPVVAVTETGRELRELSDWMLSLPGLLDVQLVSWLDEEALPEDAQLSSGALDSGKTGARGQEPSRAPAGSAEDHNRESTES